MCGSTRSSLATGPNLFEIVPQPTTLWNENTKHPSFLYVVPSSPWMTTGNALSNWIAPWSTRVNTWCPPFSVLNLAQNSNSVGPHLSKVLNCGPIPSSFSSCPWASKVFTQEATLMYGYFLSFPTFPELMSTSKRRPCWASVRATSSSLGYLRMAPSWFNFYKQGTGHNLMYTINDRLISIQFSKHIQPPIIQPEKQYVYMWSSLSNQYQVTECFSSPRYNALNTGQIREVGHELMPVSRWS